MTVKYEMRVPKIAELIAEQIRAEIVTQRVHEGDALPPESDMMGSFGASRPSVREALRILEFEGLIAIRRGMRGGAVVTRPDQQNLADRLRSAVELWATDPAEAGRIVAGAELAAVQSLAEEAKKTGAEPLLGVTASDSQFHRPLVTCSQAKLAHALFLALSETVSSECSDARAHSKTLRHIRHGDVRQAVATWQAHQARSAGSGLIGGMLATGS